MWTNMIMNMIDGFILIGVIAVCVSCYMLAKLYYDNKLLMLIKKLNHEKEMQDISWKHKVEWENKMTEAYQYANKVHKQYSELETKVGTLWKNKDCIPALDLNRIALLHLLLSGSPEALTPEMLKDEVEKVKKSYELLKDYVK